jgi:hypothetical protein
LQAYGIDVPNNVSQLYGYSCMPSFQEECTADQISAGRYVDAAVAAINRHLAFMKSHPAARCYGDAYAADRTLADKWLGVLSKWTVPYGAGSGEQRAQNLTLDQESAASQTFLTKLPSYFGDCH